MKRALVIVVFLGCGGGTKPTPVGNQAEPVVAEPEQPEPANGAVVYQRTATGGVLELRDHDERGMDDANQKMGAHCGPGNYQIIQEGVEIAGADSYADGSVNEVRVWRVHYVCL